MPEKRDTKTYAVFDHSRNRKLIGELEKSGASVIKITPAELIKTEISKAGNWLAEINSFDWIIFADVYAVEFFLDVLGENDFDLFELDNLHICALGEVVAERLRFVQIHTDVIPAVNETKKIVESIENYIYEENDFGGKKFLLLKEAGERFDVVAALEKKRAEVIESAIYRAAFTLPNELPKIKALVKGGAVDEIIFNTSEDFLQCRFVFRHEDIAEVLRGVKISAVSDAVRQTLFENRISADLFSSGL
jgi:uroporphyrinogen-III synthase